MTKLSPATEALLSAEHEVPEGQSLEHECAITLFWQSYRLGRFRQCQHDLGSMWGAGLYGSSRRLIARLDEHPSVAEQEICKSVYAIYLKHLANDQANQAA